MRIFDIIAKKRDGGELTKEEIEFFVQGYTAGNIEDYQASALVMAIYINGKISHSKQRNNRTFIQVNRIIVTGGAGFIGGSAD